MGLYVDPKTQVVLNSIASQFGGAVVSSILLVAGEAAGVAAESLVSEYPPPSGKSLALYYTRTDKKGRSYKSKFKSSKQQAFVIMKMKKEGRYRRKGTLGKSITSAAEKVNQHAVRVRIGSSAPHAPPVIGGEGQQSHYHKNTWTPLDQNILPNVGFIANRFAAAAAEQADALIAQSLK